MEISGRRKFLRNTLALAATATLGTSALAAASCAGGNNKTSENKEEGDAAKAGGKGFEFSQIALPYAYNALEPHIDAQTMEIHYTKHHATYVKNVNEAILVEKITYTTPEEFFTNASKLSAKIRNNAGGAWNHNFFWENLAAAKGQAPAGKILDAINGAFGTLDKFKEEFAKAGTGRFGSGWAWLVEDNGKLAIGSTPNQDNPLFDDAEFKGKPLLGLDVWEHAYYLHYQNKRPDYITAWWNIINWDAVAKRLG